MIMVCLLYTSTAVVPLLHKQGSSHDSTVYSDQGQEDTQLVVQSGSEFLDDHFHQLYHSGDDGDEHDKTQEAQIDSGS